jgi:hypothetical protein
VTSRRHPLLELLSYLLACVLGFVAALPFALGVARDAVASQGLRRSAHGSYFYRVGDVQAVLQDVGKKLRRRTEYVERVTWEVVVPDERPPTVGREVLPDAHRLVRAVIYPPFPEPPPPPPRLTHGGRRRIELERRPLSGPLDPARWPPGRIDPVRVTVLRLDPIGDMVRVTILDEGIDGTGPLVAELRAYVFGLIRGFHVLLR